MKKILGINDDRDFCFCCGKEGLTRVVWIQNEETGEIVHFGTTCATKQLGILFPEIKRIVKEQDEENRKQARIEFQNSPEYKAEQEAVEFMNEKFGPDFPARKKWMSENQWIFDNYSNKREAIKAKFRVKYF